MGYAQAGFDVFGVDLFEDYSQKRYPFPSHKGDAIEFLMAHGDEYDAIHASPPCQHASAGTRAQDRSKYPRLIEPVRELLQDLGRPFVIENVSGSNLINPVELCGCMFGLYAYDEDGLLLRMERTRLFETNFSLSTPLAKHVHDPDVWVAGCYGGARKAKVEPGTPLRIAAPLDRHAARYERGGGYVPRSKRVVEDLMGINWMTWKGLHQALPPVYTEWIGNQLMQHMTTAAVDLSSTTIMSIPSNHESEFIG
jgi:DNA (cytosine-5)-methyltransferase 1